ncbi:MAG: hypothetical protein IJ770_02585 [Alphaproteobacteria bacterium]|nr:hypothetical protein [Alphaproteobacteria bacterium]
MAKNYLELIKNGQADELYVSVFDNHLDNNTDSSYVDVLGEEAEVALMQKALAMQRHEADPWLEFIQQYNTKYPFCNKAIDVLFDNFDNSKSLPLLISLLSRFGYSESQGIRLCKIMLQSNDQHLIVQLLQLLCEQGRIFYPEIHRLLESIDVRIKDTEYKEHATFAESYRQAIANYRKINNLERFY